VLASVANRSDFEAFARGSMTDEKRGFLGFSIFRSQQPFSSWFLSGSISFLTSCKLSATRWNFNKCLQQTPLQVNNLEFSQQLMFTFGEDWMISAKFVALFPKMKTFCVHRAKRRTGKTLWTALDKLWCFSHPKRNHKLRCLAHRRKPPSGRENLHRCQLAETWLVVSIYRKHKGKRL